MSSQYKVIITEKTGWFDKHYIELIINSQLDYPAIMELIKLLGDVSEIVKPKEITNDRS